MNHSDSKATRGLSFIEHIVVLSAASVVLTGTYAWTGNYLVRQKVTEALAEAEWAKVAVKITCSENPAIQSLSNEQAGVGLVRSQYVGNIDLGGSCLQPRISIETINTGLPVQPILTINGNLSLESRQVTWICTTDGLDVHVPLECRKS